ncbi:MAG: flagellar export protein FliJ [bacterium]
MKKFQFRLQKLLQLRQHRKLERQKKLAKAERLRRVEEAHLESLGQRLEREQQRPRANQDGSLNVSLLQQSVRYQERLKQDQGVQKQMVARARENEARRREELLAAAIKEKVFLKLRERRQDQYHADLERRDQKETDEIAIQQFLHKQ